MVAAYSPEGLPAWAPRRLVEALGRMALEGRSSDGLGHPHGWGIVAGRRGRLVEYRRSLSPAWAAGYSEAYEADVVVAHARRASSGGVLLRNVHPFVRSLGPGSGSGPGGGWLALAHNGEVRWRSLPPGVRPEDLDGDTDSEVMLAHLAASGLGDPVEAARAVLEVPEMPEVEGVRSVTSLITDGATLAAAVGAAEGPDYFSLHLAEAEWAGRRVWLLASEPLPGLAGGWERLPNWGVWSPG